MRPVPIMMANPHPILADKGNPFSTMKKPERYPITEHAKLWWSHE
jgi:hypothetical protein